MASYRYRAAIPASVLGAEVNPSEGEFDVLVFSKPCATDITLMRAAKGNAKLVVDICDPHLHLPEYQEALRLADAVTCSTDVIASHLRNATVIPEPYELPEREPHAEGERFLWFGHASNLIGLLAWRQHVPCRVVTGQTTLVDAVPWSVPNLMRELEEANVCLFPEAAPYKSNNRLVEALRMGCWAICGRDSEFSQWVYVGHPKMGLSVCRAFRDELNDRVREAQAYIRDRYSPERIAALWREVL